MASASQFSLLNDDATVLDEARLCLKGGNLLPSLAEGA